MADRVGVSSTENGVHWFMLNPWMIVTAPPCAVQMGPVCEGDILTLLESGWDARRSRWYAHIGLTAGGSSVQSSIQFHIDGQGYP